MEVPHTHRVSWHNEGDVHFLTFSTFQRRPFFSDPAITERFLQTLATARLRCPFHLFAYVIMPTHVHLMLQPPPEISMRRVLSQIKQPMTAITINWARNHEPAFLTRMAREHATGKTTYHFWQQGGGYDRNMRSRSDVHEKIGYIHKNPVRKEFVSRSEDWPYSSAAEWVLGVKGKVPLDWDHLPSAELKR